MCHCQYYCVGGHIVSEGQGKEEKDTDWQSKGCATEIAENHMPVMIQTIFFLFLVQYLSVA